MALDPPGTSLPETSLKCSGPFDISQQNVPGLLFEGVWPCARLGLPCQKHPQNVLAPLISVEKMFQGTFLKASGPGPPWAPSAGNNPKMFWPL